jgi:hypothetical protein
MRVRQTAFMPLFIKMCMKTPASISDIEQLFAPQIDETAPALHLKK